VNRKIGVIMEYKNEAEKTWCEREINKLIPVNDLVESMLKHNADYPHSDNEFTYENIENLFQPRCPECGDVLDESIVNDEISDNDFYECVCKAKLDEVPESEIQEILQWWIVDAYIARKLKAICEPVLSANSLYFWGRTCCGQHVSVDGTFQKIYRSLDRG
jgi:hypothetical protein